MGKHFYFSSRLLLGILVLVIPWAAGIAVTRADAPLALRLLRPGLLAAYLCVFLFELWHWARDKKSGVN